MAELEDPPRGEISAQLDESKHINEANGAEYWMARELMPILGYTAWENFRQVISRAVDACSSSGIHVSHQIRETTKKVGIGSGATRDTLDFFLTRYACYLIAMNGDPSKPQIGYAQTYFAIQARKQEMQDHVTEEDKRIALRQRVKDANRNLGGVAKSAGVQRFDIFNDAGYKGLYGGHGVASIKAKKEIPAADDLLDRCGRAELAMNEFRITQTEQKLVRDKVRGQTIATNTHYAVGQSVRDTIKKIGGTMPEALKAKPSLKKIEAARKKRERLEQKAAKLITSSARIIGGEQV